MPTFSWTNLTSPCRWSYIPPGEVRAQPGPGREEGREGLRQHVRVRACTRVCVHTYMRVCVRACARAQDISTRREALHSFGSQGYRGTVWALVRASVRASRLHCHPRALAQSLSSQVFAGLQVESAGQQHVPCLSTERGPGREPEGSCSHCQGLTGRREWSPTGWQFAPPGRAGCIVLSLGWQFSTEGAASPQEGLTSVSPLASSP